MKFNPEDHTTKKKSRNRNIDVLWFNPPYSKSIKTRIGAKFLKLIDKHFPKSNPLHILINRKTTKIGYKTTSNMKKIISTHNQKVLRNSDNSAEKPMCNCRSKPNCPVQGKCLVDNVVYQAEVETDKEKQTYVGLCSTAFKDRFRNHETSFNNSKTPTTLARHVCELKEKGENYEVRFKIIGRARPYSPISGICNLCTLEKYHIIFTPALATLNKKEEINNQCLHKHPLLLDKT